METTVARHLLSRALPAVLILLLSASSARTTFAQQTAGEEDDAPPRPYINLDLRLDDNGIAKINLSGYLPNNSIRVFQSALESSLGCSLQEEPRHRESPYFYSATCAMPLHKAGLVRETGFHSAPLQTLAGQYEIETISAQFTLPDTKIEETVPPSPQTRLPDEPQYARARKYLSHKHFFLWSKLLRDLPRSCFASAIPPEPGRARWRFSVSFFSLLSCWFTGLGAARGPRRRRMLLRSGSATCATCSGRLRVPFFSGGLPSRP